MFIKGDSMKKKIILLLVIVSLFMLTGCSTKTPLEANDFVDLVEQNNYKTTNVVEQFSTYAQIKNAFVAQDSEMRYQIEYYELDTDENAKTFFEGNKKIFEQQSNKKSHSSVNLNNYNKYSQSTETVYSVISRIDNTVIYANVKIEYKKEVQDIIKKLGY